MTLQPFPRKTITCASCKREVSTPAGGRGRRYCGEKACQSKCDAVTYTAKKKARTA